MQVTDAIISCSSAESGYVVHPVRTITTWEQLPGFEELITVWVVSDREWRPLTITRIQTLSTDGGTSDIIRFIVSGHL